MKLAHVASQLVAKQRPPDATAHKWTVFRAICAARERLGLSERALAVLDALLSFHPETVLTGDGLVVFPSNEQLSLRAHGMPASTLRRQLAMLVDAGIVVRRDSPNGKRYARKGRNGEVAKAFGFDLSPLVARAAEFESLAEEVRDAERALRFARERITLARRDIAKMIAAALEEGVRLSSPVFGASTWADVHALYRALVARIPRSGSLLDIEPVAQELSDLAESILTVLETHIKTEIPSANESRSERHKQNSSSQTNVDLEPAFEKSGDDAAPAASEPLAAKTAETTFPLGFVLRACPDIADYARSGVSNWRDFLAAAAVARAALGISPSAWEAARAAMGERPAAIVVAAILQRGAAITSGGGYLRELTRKAQANAFSLGPMLMALIGARERAAKRA